MEPVEMLKLLDVLRSRESEALTRDAMSLIQGMTPRDANFLGPENHTCLVRQEILVLYNRHQSLQHAKEHMAPFEKEFDEERKTKEPVIEEGKEPTVE